jgi:hypothetical protein
LFGWRVTYIAAGVGSTCHHTHDEHTTDTGLHYPTIFPRHIDDIDAEVMTTSRFVSMNKLAEELFQYDPKKIRNFCIIAHIGRMIIMYHQ